MYISKYIYTFICCCCFLFSKAGIVHISGTAKSYEGRNIRAYQYIDYVSEEKQAISESAYIDEKGKFDFSFDIIETTYLFLKIGNYRVDFYAEPGKNYELTILPKDATVIETINKDAYVDYRLEAKDSLDLNKLISAYSHEADKFYSNYYFLIMKKLAQKKVDSFRVAINKQFEKINHPYFKNYLKYNVALLENQCTKSRKYLYETYLDSSPVQVNNKEYMDFFNEYFTDYLDRFGDTPNGGNIIGEINNNKSFSGCLEALRKDKQIHNDTIRQLLVIKGLYENYYKKEYNKKSIIQALEKTDRECNIDELKTLAKRLKSKLLFGQPGTYFKDQTLKNPENKEVKLSQYKGKYIYLMVGTSWSADYWQELKLVKAFTDKYEKKITFISVLIDEDYEKSLQLKTQYKTEWDFLNGADNEEFLQEFNIKSVPSFFLISPDGYFIQSPADKPSGDIEKTFYELNKKK